MQTISINCTGRTLRNVKKQIRNLFHLQKRKSGRDLYCSRCVNFYLDMLGTSNGDNFSYISLERLAHDNQCEIVTARRGVKRLTAGGWVVPGVKYIPGKGFMKGFFLLAHRLIVRLLQGIAGLVLRFHDDGPETVETEQVVDNLSSSLTIRTELTVKNPPLPPRKRGAPLERRRRCIMSNNLKRKIQRHYVSPEILQTIVDMSEAMDCESIEELQLKIMLMGYAVNLKRFSRLPSLDKLKKRMQRKATA